MLWIGIGILALFMVFLLYACCVVSGSNRCEDCIFRLECEKTGYKCFERENRK